MGFGSASAVFEMVGMGPTLQKIPRRPDGSLMKVAVDLPGISCLHYYGLKKTHGSVMATFTIEQKIDAFVDYMKPVLARIHKQFVPYFTVPGRSSCIKNSEHVKRQKSAAVQKASYVRATDEVKQLTEAKTDAVAHGKQFDVSIAERQIELATARQEQQFANTFDADWGKVLRGLINYLIENEFVIFGQDDREDEIHASYLTSIGKFDAVWSADFDVILMDPGLVIRELKGGNGMIIDTHEFFDKVQSVLHLDRRQFLDATIIIGDDFAKLPSFGPKRAIQYMQRYGSIERMIESGDKVVKKALEAAELNVKKFPFVEARAQFDPFDYDDLEGDDDDADDLCEMYAKEPDVWLPILRDRICEFEDVESKTFTQHIYVKVKNMTSSE